MEIPTVTIRLDEESTKSMAEFTEDMVKLNQSITEAVYALKEYKKTLDSLPWYARLYMFFTK